MAVAPLAVCAGANQPQPPGAVLPHCVVQVTPPGGISLATVTLTGTCVTLTSVAGGGCVKDSVGGGGDATMVVVAIAAFEGVIAANEAVIVTTAPSGTEVGAV